MTILQWMRNPLARVLMLLVVFGATAVGASVILKIAVDPGSTTVVIDGRQVQIDTTASVVVQLQSVDGTITGAVEPAPGVRSSDVTITVLGSPSVVIFKGRVTGPIVFEDYIFTQESGRGEQ